MDKDFTQDAATVPDSTPDKTARYRTLFFEESTEQLQEAERCLLRSADTDDKETAATLFRCVHSIKSGAAAFGMQRVVALAHIFESTLEELRRGSFALDQLRRHMFFRGYDMIAKLLAAEAAGQALPENAEAELINTFQGLSCAASAVRIDAGSTNAASLLAMPLPIVPSTIRIELSKIDRLVNLASELTILQSMLRQRTEGLLIATGISNSAGESLLQGLDQLALQLRDLQHATMQARAQPLDNVFQRLPRLVRDLADNLGKRVELAMTGGDAEVDKTIIEQLAEPLTHILRNAIDHGIELPATRQEHGKPASGTIAITAHCADNRLLITVADDGRGLDLEALRRKAGARGVDISDHAALADTIFLPGLSTANTVSEISGRGVGLDAVRHNLAALGGSITVSSSKGAGTYFTLSLPLTLAVMDAMIVTIGGEFFVLPLADVKEAISVPPEAVIIRSAMPPLIRHADRYVL